MNNNLKRMKRNEKKGFTLVEIIVVLVILAIMAAIAVPAVMGYIQDAKDSQYVSEARTIYIVAQAEDAKETAADASFSHEVSKDNINAKLAKNTGNNLTVTSNVDLSGSSITIEFKSDTNEITATIDKNKEVKITH